MHRPRNPRTDRSLQGEQFRLSADYLLTAVSAWLLPGAGHFLLGYRVRGLVLAGSILGLFWMGEALAVPERGAHGEEGKAHPIAVSHRVNPVFFACQVGNGFSTLLADRLWGKPLYEDSTERIDGQLPRNLNLAILFTSVSGLLNYLLVLHILDPRTWAERRRALPGG